MRERRRASVWAFHSHFIHEHRMTSSSWPARRQQIVHSQNPKAARQLFCSVLSQLGLVALSSQPSSTPSGDFFLAVTDTGIPSQTVTLFQLDYFASQMSKHQMLQSMFYSGRSGRVQCAYGPGFWNVSVPKDKSTGGKKNRWKHVT